MLLACKLLKLIYYSTLTDDREIDHFYVAPEQQGRFLSARLFRRMLRIAKEKKLKILTSYVSNTVLPMTLKLGFKKIKTIIRKRKNVPLETNLVEFSMEDLRY